MKIRAEELEAGHRVLRSDTLHVHHVTRRTPDGMIRVQWTNNTHTVYAPYSEVVLDRSADGAGGWDREQCDVDAEVLYEIADGGVVGDVERAALAAIASRLKERAAR